MAFGSFKSDIKRAVTYIQPELDDFPQEAATLQKMVAHEGKPGDKASGRSSSCQLLPTLLWLNAFLILCLDQSETRATACSG
jgi:hypothetical protein